MIKSKFPEGTFKKIQIGKKTYNSLDEMGDFIKEYNKSVNTLREDLRKGITQNSFSNLIVKIDGVEFNFNATLEKTLAMSNGELVTTVKTKVTYSSKELNIDSTPVKQALIRNGLEDIINEVITGKSIAEKVKDTEHIINTTINEIEQIEKRQGRPFEFEEELKDAQTKVKEYEKAMQIELAEKEAKYKEMDEAIEEAVDVELSEEADEEDDGDLLYRDADQELPATINIDGVERPTTNSEGKHIAQTEEGIRNFWQWFGDSKVVDAEGRPLVVYHGTASTQSYDSIVKNGFDVNERGLIFSIS